MGRTAASNSDKIKAITSLGMRLPKDEQYVCLKIVGKYGSNYLFKIKHLLSGETVIRRDNNLKKASPWKQWVNPSITIRELNKIGKMYKRTDQFICLSVSEKNNHKTATIKSLSTGEVVTRYVHCLKQGNNPFRSDVELHEKRVVHPLVKKELLKMGLKLESEFYLSDKSRLDFLCTNNKGRKIIIEVKSDKKKHSKNDLSKQISKYKTEGKKRFGNAYAGTFLVSLNGRYGYSLKELSLVLKSKGLISR